MPAYCEPVTREDVVKHLDEVCAAAPAKGYRVLKWRRPGETEICAHVTSFAWEEMTHEEKLDFIMELNEMGIENG